MIGALLLSVAPFAAQVDPPIELVAHDRVAISAEGGISLGAYEGGLNWAFLRMLRDERDTRGTELVTATGASAGNINAIISAIEWCAIDDVDAFDSLFWKMWIEVGMVTLFPMGKPCEDAERDLGTADPARACRNAESTYGDEDGLFSRRALRDVQRVARARIESGGFRPGCALPIGVSATKANPIVVPLRGSTLNGGPGVDVPMQRFVAPLIVRAKDDGSGLGFFRDAERERRAATAGPLLVLPTIDDRVSMERVLRLVEVSSAFPIAFGPAPMDVCTPPGLFSEPPLASLPAHEACRADETAVRARFLDGGLFDANPIGLTMSLAAPPDGASTEGATRFIYLSTVGRRGWPVAERAPTRAVGAGYVLEAAQSFFRTARGYELQVLQRSLEEHGVAAPNILATTRHMPIFGEHLALFAAFFARTFREYDFYVGVYDALVEEARAVCAPADDACIRERLRTHLAQFGSKDRNLDYVVRAQTCAEFSPTHADPWACDPLLQPTRRIFAAYTRAQARLATAWRNALEHPENDDAEDFRERGAFASLLDELRAEHADRILLEDELPRARLDTARPWLAEETLVAARLISAPSEELGALVLRVLERAQQIERSDVNFTSLAALRFTELTLASAKTIEAPSRPDAPGGAVVLPSSAVDVMRGPDNWDILAIATRALPQWIGVDVLHGGIDAGWRPVGWFVGRGPINVGFQGTAGLVLHPGSTGYVDRGLVSFGHVFALRTPGLSPFLTRSEAGVRVSLTMLDLQQTRHPFGLSALDQGLEVGVYTLGDKLRLGASYRNVRSGDAWDQLSITLGVNDVPGFVYWATRWAIESSVDLAREAKTDDLPFDFFN